MKTSFLLIVLLGLGSLSAQQTPQMPASGQSTSQPSAPSTLPGQGSATTTQPQTGVPSSPGGQAQTPSAPTATPAPGAQTPQTPASQTTPSAPTTPQTPASQTAAPTTPSQAQPAPAAAPAQGEVPAPPQTPPPPPRKAPEIKDQAEYSAYVSAIQQQNPQTKVSALEGFLNTYSQSVLKEDVLEQLIAAYQQAQNPAKVEDAAKRLLQVNPNNVRGLAILAFLARAKMESGQAQAQAAQLAQEAVEYGRKGLEALPTLPRPEQMSEADYNKLRNQMFQIFVGAIGFGDLQTKNFAEAARYLQAAVNADPTQLNNVYPLAVAYLEQNPPNPVGFWYAAKAVDLAASTGPAGQQQINGYGRAKYFRYHGSDDQGWNQLVASAKSASAPPENFSVEKAPSPAEQAAKMVGSKPVSQMSLDEIQFILTSGNQQASDQVWNEIKGKPIAVEGKLVSGSGNELMIAGLYDDIQANPPKSDINLSLTNPLPARALPGAGSMIQFQGNPVSFEPNPFLLKMDSGCIIKNGKCMTAAATPPRRTGTGTARRRPPANNNR